MVKILVVGELGSEGNDARRARVMAELGHAVCRFRTRDWLPGSRWAERLRFNLGIGPGLARLNREFVATAEREQPAIIWVEKGIYLWGSAIRAAKRACAAIVAHYQPDNPFGEHRRGWRIFRAAIPDYDVHFECRPANVANYVRRGAKRVELYDRGFDPAVHRPLELTAADRAEFAAPVGFVGSWGQCRARSMAMLADAGIPLAIRGNGYPGRHYWRDLRPHFRGPAVYGDRYAKAICGLEIALHFLCGENRDEQDSRSFEIPACGAFMLAEQSPKHLEIFAAGREAEFFATDAELLAKVEFFRAHPADRQAIAAAGHTRCLTSGYDHASRLRDLLARLLAPVQ